MSASPTLSDSASWRRYPRLYGCFLRYCLKRELNFRVNFVVRAVLSVGWLLLIVFYFDLIFGQTKAIGDWNRQEYLFLMGTWFILFGLVETLFLENCTRFSELIRTGNLDLVLIKPVDEQFLISLERVDWAEVPSMLFGVGMLFYSTYVGNLDVTFGRSLAFVALLACGVAILYSFMLSLASISVWVVRTQSLHELWFYIAQFGRFPSEIYADSTLGIGIRVVLMYLIPVMLAVNVPARVAVKSIAWPYVVYTAVAAVLLLAFSRWFFHLALSRYRSASS